MSSPATTEFGKKLRQFRLKNGLTQSMLASLSGVSDRTIRLLEGGQSAEPRFETVRLLANALELTDQECEAFIASARGEQAPGGVPPLVARSAHRSHKSSCSRVPNAVTSFVGRQRVLAAVCTNLRSDSIKLQTLIGPGGIGKTRLALEAARTVEAHFVHGVCLVMLDSVAEADLVVSAIAEALAISDQMLTVTPEELADQIGEAHLLLLLDNMEHVLPAAYLAPLLLERCPNLRILATSRAPLQVSGEHRISVHPLSFPAGHHPDAVGSFPATEAEQLFMHRAMAVDPTLETTEENAALIASICQRLDGIPLAIELAAAQLWSVSLEALLAGMDLVLPALVDGPVDKPKRLQTMAGSLDWSYGLISARAQRLLRGLAVFRGGFDLESAAAVDASMTVDSHGETSREITRLVLDDLVNKSMVARLSGSVASQRYGLLELVREYAGKRLRSAGEHSIAREAHASYFLELAERYASVDWIPGDPDLQHRFAEELPNIREALAWLEEIGDGERMLRFTGSLDWFYNTHSHAIEGRRWLERAIAIGSAASPAARATGELVLAQVLSYLGEHQRSEAHNALGLESALEAQEPFLLAWALVANAAMAIYNGDFLRGKELCYRAIDVIDQIEDDRMRHGITLWTPGTLARAEHGLGNLETAASLLEEAAKSNLDFGHARGAARFLGNQGTLAIDQGDVSRALQCYQHGVSLAYGDGDHVYAATNLRMVAAALALSNEPRCSARLLGAIESFERDVGPLVMWTPMDLRVKCQGLQALHHALDPDTIAEEMDVGRALSLAEAATAAGVNLDEAALAER